MAEPSVAENQGRVKRKVEALLHSISGEADAPAGAASLNRSNYWVGVADPNTSAPTGVAVGDICLDRTGDEVYRYVATDTWISMTADA